MKEPVAIEKPKSGVPAEGNVYAGVYKVLLGGMLASTSLFVIAIIRALLHPQFVPLTPEWIQQQYHRSAIVKGILSFDPTIIMLIATVLLILTPVVRVVVSIYAFAVDGDRKYVAVTAIVLLVMAVTVVLGIFGLR